MHSGKRCLLLVCTHPLRAQVKTATKKCESKNNRPANGHVNLLIWIEEEGHSGGGGQGTWTGYYLLLAQAFARAGIWDVIGESEFALKQQELANNFVFSRGNSKPTLKTVEQHW
jgi:hypothetical protein